MKSTKKEFFSKCDQICSFRDYFIFAEQIVYGKLHLLFNDAISSSFILPEAKKFSYLSTSLS